jgi:hypothetical protein
LCAHCRKWRVFLYVEVDWRWFDVFVANEFLEILTFQI